MRRLGSVVDESTAYDVYCELVSWLSSAWISRYLEQAIIVARRKTERCMAKYTINIEMRRRWMPLVAMAVAMLIHDPRVEVEDWPDPGSCRLSMRKHNEGLRGLCDATKRL